MEDLEQLNNIVEYIRQSRGLHVEDKEIARSLYHAAWPVNMIQKAFASLKKDPIIQVRELFKEYRLSEEVTVQAIDGLYYLDVYEGEFLSISGQSGSGKSTLLNILGLIDEPTRGDVIIKGVSTARMSDRQKTKHRLNTLSYVFQFFNLLENFTAEENIMFQVRMGGVSKREAKKKAKEILGFLGMESRAKNYPSELSGGQQQRIAIGRAIAKEAPLILADEPTAHLDTHNAEKVIELLRKVNVMFGRTVVLVTHEHSYAKMADRIVYLTDGKLSGIEDRAGASFDWKKFESEVKEEGSKETLSTDDSSVRDVLN